MPKWHNFGKYGNTSFQPKWHNFGKYGNTSFQPKWHNFGTYGNTAFQLKPDLLLELILLHQKGIKKFKTNFNILKFVADAVLDHFQR